MFSRCYCWDFLIHHVVTYVPVLESAVSQAHTSSWSLRFLWCFLLLLSALNCSFHVHLPIYHYSWLSICLHFLLIFWFLTALSFSFSIIFSFSHFLSLFHPTTTPWLWWLKPLALSGHSCIWLWKRKFHGWTLLLASASRLVSLCKYLQRGIIDCPTHLRWSPTVLQAHIRARNGAEHCLDIAGEGMMQCNTTWHNTVVGSWGVAGTDLASSVSLCLSWTGTKQWPPCQTCRHHGEFFFPLQLYTLFILRSICVLCLGEWIKGVCFKQTDHVLSHMQDCPADMILFCFW